MNRNQQNELIREYPINLWVPAVIFFAVGIYTYFRGFPIGISVGGVVIGLLLVVFSTVLVVEFNYDRTSLIFLRAGLLRRSMEELPVSEIKTVFVEQSRSRDSDSSSTYRVVIGLESGEVVPLRNYFSSGYQAKERTAQLLRDAIGVEGYDQSPQGVLEMASELIQGAYQPDGEILGELEEQETGGVRWQMHTISLGNTPVNRWLSKDFTTPEQFLYLVQKIENQDSGRMVMNLMGKTLMRQSLRLYGFSDVDIPNIEDAVVLEELDESLDKLFMGYASDEIDTNKLLNTEVVAPLVKWADNHPLHQRIKQPDEFNQLVLLFSPNGVYVSCLGNLSEDGNEHLINLGVEVMQALGD